MKKTLVLLLLCVLIATQEASTLTKSSLGNERNIGTCAKFTSDK